MVKLPTGFALLKVLQNSEMASLAEAERVLQQAVSASSSVRYAFDLSGLFEAETALGDIPKPPGWDQNLQLMCSTRLRSLAAAREGTAKFFDPASEGAMTRSLYDAMSMRIALGQLYAYDGKMDEAIQQWETAYGMTPESS